MNPHPPHLPTSYLSPHLHLRLPSSSTQLMLSGQLHFVPIATTNLWSINHRFSKWFTCKWTVHWHDRSPSHVTLPRAIHCSLDQRTPNAWFFPHLFFLKRTTRRPSTNPLKPIHKTIATKPKVFSYVVFSHDGIHRGSHRHLPCHLPSPPALWFMRWWTLHCQWWIIFLATGNEQSWIIAATKTMVLSLLFTTGFPHPIWFCVLIFSSSFCPWKQQQCYWPVEIISY